MTIYEQTWATYQLVDSPLNEEYNFYLQNGAQPTNVDVIQRRMMTILGFVAILVFTAVFILPGIILTSKTNSTSYTVTTTQPNDGLQTGIGETAVMGNMAAASGQISPIFSPEVQHWAPQIVDWGSRYGLDPDIVATIMQIESCGDPQAMSGAGAQGLFQVMPFHFSAGERMLDPETNAARGLAYYAERLEQTGGNVYQAFAGYNGGHVAAAGNWNSWVDETQRYYTWSKGIYDDAKSGVTESVTLKQWMQAGGASLCRQASNRLVLR